MSFIWAFGVRVWQTALRLFYTTLHFFKKDYANFILTLSMVLSYICLSYYLRIITHGIIDEIDLTKTPTYSPDQIESYDSDIQIGKLEELAHLTDSYSNIQAFNSWLIILRIIFELGFVRELSFVLDLIGESLLELVFFVATFAIVIIFKIPFNHLIRLSLVSQLMVIYFLEKNLKALEVLQDLSFKFYNLCLLVQIPMMMLQELSLLQELYISCLLSLFVC